MAYVPIQSPKWSERDALPQGDQRKIIKAADFDTEFTNIQAEFDRLSSAGNANAASVKFNGTDIMYSHNVREVRIPPDPNFDLDGNPRNAFWDSSWKGGCAVYFNEALLDDFDHHYAVVIQPYATGYKHVIATVTDQRRSGVEWTWMEWNGSQWVEPAVNLGFSMIVVDMVQN